VTPRFHFLKECMCYPLTTMIRVYAHVFDLPYGVREWAHADHPGGARHNQHECYPRSDPEELEQTYPVILLSCSCSFATNRAWPSVQYVFHSTFNELFTNLLTYLCLQERSESPSRNRLLNALHRRGDKSTSCRSRITWDDDFIQSG
jgi:hypothetical protein